jgi:nitrosocyanin
MRTTVTAAVLLAAALLLAPLARVASAAEAAPTRKATFVNVQYEGSKIWLPGTLAVTKGTHVDLTLINNVPSGQHGFSIPGYGVAVVVEKGKPAHVSFTADRTGVFPIICQLHPAHVGGQLIVLP